MLYRIDNGLLDEEKHHHQFNKIFVWAGTNNMERCKPEQVMNGIKELIRQIKQYRPMAQIILFTLTRRNSKGNRFKKKNSLKKLLDKIIVTNVMIKEFAHTHNYQCVDLYPLFHEDKYHFDDHVHLNKKGYALLFETIQKFV